jgi:hypothetical protein
MDKVGHTGLSVGLKIDPQKCFVRFIRCGHGTIF